VLLYIPFLRRIQAILGYYSCSQGSLAKVSYIERHGPSYPYNIVHLPAEGVEEVLNNNEQTILLKRKGYIKLALETREDLIPHYTLATVWTRPSSILAKISPKLRVSILMWFGFWWIPMGFVAFRVPILRVIGPVMEIP
jgi:hypothetical protein